MATPTGWPKSHPVTLGSTPCTVKFEVECSHTTQKSNSIEIKAFARVQLIKDAAGGNPAQQLEKVIVWKTYTGTTNESDGTVTLTADASSSSDSDDFGFLDAQGNLQKVDLKVSWEDPVAVTNEQRHKVVSVKANFEATCAALSLAKTDSKTVKFGVTAVPK